MEQVSYSVYRATIDQIMLGQEKLPSLPDITLKIRQEAANPNTTIDRLAEMIAADPSLTVMLMRYACSPLYRTQQTPKSLDTAIGLLGIPSVDRLIMLHSVKSLFIMQSPKLKKLFNIAWQRQTLKAATSRFLAQKLGFNPPDEALIACLLSEIGTLAILSALTDAKEVPSQQVYFRLCREYSKSLGVIILKKWSLDNRYAEIVRHCGDWTQATGQQLSVTDIINLALYHTIALLKKDHNLPDIESLPAYQKLPPPFNQVGKNGLLHLVNANLKDIVGVARSLH
ncbi:hypothetical protein R50073_47230 [Maricurvus nonylphenolicus]|uniref:HDOD domain-containing protein n=1 Tax=Maricurvus nonylphenolicus TaxID=1008307 RepID=UPI0036F383D7